MEVVIPGEKVEDTGYYDQDVKGPHQVMGESRPAQFPGGGLPDKTKFYCMPSVVEQGNMSLYVYKPVADEYDKVRHCQDRKYCEKLEMNSEALASF